MPIWSLTLERLEKLKAAIEKKKAEHDELQAKSEKDLWCIDLDEFTEVWNAQLILDAEIQTNIRRMGRRESKKIGAGRNKKAKGEDAYEPEKKGKAAKAKAPVKVETKSSQRFADMFGAKPKVKAEPKQSEKMDLSDNFSDDDFAALNRSKPAPKAAAAPSTSRAMSTSARASAEPDNTRNKRAAASKARAFFGDDSDSDDDDKLLGDVGDLVKGIGKTAGESSGRVSLYAMSRPESSSGNAAPSGLPKMKSKPSRALDSDSLDDTNYEMLAKSSPHKPKPTEDDIDDFLSDDEDMAPVVPAAKAVMKPAVKAAALSSAKAPSGADAKPAGFSEIKKSRAKPAVAKAKVIKEPAVTAKSKPTAKLAEKTLVLSPAAKAYAAKKATKKTVFDDDSDDDMDGGVASAIDSSPPVKAAARTRPGRAAAARRPIVLDEDSSMQVDDDESEDPFEVDDDDD